MYTWSFAYNIDAIREWLFAQKSIKSDDFARKSW